MPYLLCFHIFWRHFTSSYTNPQTQRLKVGRASHLFFLVLACVCACVCIILCVLYSHSLFISVVFFTTLNYIFTTLFIIVVVCCVVYALPARSHRDTHYLFSTNSSFYLVCPLLFLLLRYMILLSVVSSRAHTHAYVRRRKIPYKLLLLLFSLFLLLMCACCRRRAYRASSHVCSCVCVPFFRCVYYFLSISGCEEYTKTPSPEDSLITHTHYYHVEFFLLFYSSQRRWKKKKKYI